MPVRGEAGSHGDQPRVRWLEFTAGSRPPVRFDVPLPAAVRTGTAGPAWPTPAECYLDRHQVQVIGLNIGVLVQAAPQLFGEVMGELFALIAAGVLTPGQPAVYELADGPKALAELESRATAGKLALLP